MKNAIIGAGSIGTIIGALASRNGADIVMIDSDERIVAALNRNGAAITGSMEMTTPVKALTPREMSGKYGIVILITKQTANKAVLENLLPYLDKKSIVCTLQNGLPEEAVAGFVGKERTVGGTVRFGATYLAPGVSRLTSSSKALEKGTFKIGTMDGTKTNQLKAVQRLLSNAADCTPTSRLMGIRWTKLLINATMSGMSAALGCVFRDILHNDKARACAAHLADETIKVAHAEGIRLEPLSDIDFERLALSGPEDAINKRDLFFEIWGNHQNLKASMLQDLEKGRRCEVAFINGVVCEKGSKHGVLTPFNDKVADIIRTKERTGKIHIPDALCSFDPLLKI